MKSLICLAVRSRLNGLLTVSGHPNIDFLRYRGRGCWVSPAKLGKKFEKQFTKMAAHKHGITFMVPTCGVNNTKEVNVMIKKSKPSRVVVDERRSAVLAATIFPFISDILNSGELEERTEENFDDLQMNVTRLEVTRDFSSLRLYWYSGNNSLTMDEENQKKLDRLGAFLRDSLAAASILPSIPPIVFVMDKEEKQRRQFLEALQSIDLGPDYVPSEEVQESMQSEPEKVPEWLRKGKKRPDPESVDEVKAK